jgi:mono/diheme cytochrome c family protein
MSARRLLFGVAAALAAVVPASAQDSTRGQEVFDHSCAPCHGAGVGDDGRAMLPGTAALEIKYRETDIPPLLEERTDLTADALTLFVRQGVMSMPPFRKTELSDQDIADIAAYLAEASPD